MILKRTLPVARDSSATATDLASALVLVNSLQDTLNAFIDADNLLREELRGLGDIND